MPLLDHFHPPLSVQRHWHSFHNAWATFIASQLNQRLPAGYFAEGNVQFGIEIDVAAFADSAPSGATSVWTPPAPAVIIPIATATDVIEILVHHQEGDPILAGAIELVSPTNKDREAHRDAFVSKCASYLHEGVGLVIVDVVTDRLANFHQLVTQRLGTASPAWPAEIYAVAYHPVQFDGQSSLQIWPHELALGAPLPTLPLWLRGGPCIPVDFESAYMRTCQEYRVPVNGKA